MMPLFTIYVTTNLIKTSHLGYIFFYQIILSQVLIIQATFLDICQFSCRWRLLLCMTTLPVYSVTFCIRQT